MKISIKWNKLMEIVIKWNKLMEIVSKLEIILAIAFICWIELVLQVVVGMIPLFHAFSRA